ncbi:DUF2147 domain-containing protein [Acinetobacter venetianus]|uniref:DUF2147 domain-containing protein n=1 Tax=Acinetobacter venetianus TaxID=52133 RepID=UPI00177B90CC|nr:DUF2147 domain-containing protein [Acinetobacter venetianus]
MKNQTFTYLAIFSVMVSMSTTLWANEIVGTWKAMNDKTGAHEANVEIYQNKNGKYDGKIEKILALPNGAPQKFEKCVHCSGDLKNQPIIGLQILSNFIKNPKNSNEYINGTVVDPESGKTYKGTIRLSSNGRKITLNGYVGISLLGRTQTWIKIKEE